MKIGLLIALAIPVIFCSCSNRSDVSYHILISKHQPPFSRKCPVISVDINGETVLYAKDGQKQQRPFVYRNSQSKEIRLSASCLTKDLQEIGRKSIFVDKRRAKITISSADQFDRTAYSVGKHPSILIR